jgi:hypothetical protein
MSLPTFEETKATEPNLSWGFDDEEDDEGGQALWALFLESFQDHIDGMTPENCRWLATVENFGWQKLGGEKEFKAEDAEELLQQILPKTECHFKIWIDMAGQKIRLQNFHHDSPTGDEIYTIRPSTGEEE